MIGSKKKSYLSTNKWISRYGVISKNNIFGSTSLGINLYKKAFTDISHIYYPSITAREDNNFRFIPGVTFIR